MKKTFITIGIIAAFVLTGCQKEELTPIFNGKFVLRGYSDLSKETKTTFGTPGASTIPFLLSAQDKIYAGSYQSNAISEGGATAEFVFEGTSDIANLDVYYNMTGTSATQANILRTQTQGATLNLGANGDFGYAVTNNDGVFSLGHYTSYLWFNPYSTDVTSKLTSVKVEASTAIAGKATFDKATTTFGAITEGSNEITLTITGGLTLPEVSSNEVLAAMVIYPVNLSGTVLKITYAFEDGSYFTATRNITSTFTAGKTYRISDAITAAETYKIRTLTFEDADYKGATNFVGEQNWSSLIDNPQYGGVLLYGDPMGSSDYFWIDGNNTELASEFPLNWGSTCYWGGGHAISNYVDMNLSNGDYNHQLSVYYEDTITHKGGHNGSDNFCMHYGYHDNSGYSSENVPYFYFSDGEERVIDHMFVTNNTYAVNCYIDGNSLTAKIGEGDWVKISARGLDSNGDETGVCEFYLCNGPDHIITSWTKFDLSSLGRVLKVEFNILGSSDNGYGFSQPAYFAYDDVAVRFSNE